MLTYMVHLGVPYMSTCRWAIGFKTCTLEDTVKN